LDDWNVGNDCPYPIMEKTLLIPHNPRPPPSKRRNQGKKKPQTKKEKWMGEEATTNMNAAKTIL